MKKKYRYKTKFNLIEDLGYLFLTKMFYTPKN